MQTAKKIIGIIVTILLGIIVTYNVYNLYSLKILHKDLATVNGYGILEVVSGSMEPTIHVGDMIIINTKDKNYQEGNIITFYDSEGTFTTHRIIKMEGDKIVTQGDNNDSEDNYDLTRDKVVGKYVWRLGGAGKLLAAFKSPLTMIMILVIGVLTCILISTDKDGNPILSEDEKEFEEFLEYKNAQETKNSVTKVKEPIKEKSTSKTDKLTSKGKTANVTTKPKTAVKTKSTTTKKKVTIETSKVTSKKETTSKSSKKTTSSSSKKSTPGTKPKKATTNKKQTSTSKAKKN